MIDPPAPRQPTARAAGHPREGGEPRWQRAPIRRTLGVVLIVKDEADNLPALFETIAEVADEVVVVDTGSTDRTVAICRSWGVKVVHQPWRNDFALARNRSIAEAGSTYLLWLDADDRLPPSTQAELRRLRDDVLPTLRNRAFKFEIRSLNADGEAFGVVGGVFLQTRLFPRLRDARFRNAVHEEIDSSLQTLGVHVVPIDLVVEHVGYMSPEVRQAKARRNEALLRGELEREPGNFSLLLHMAMTLRALDRHEEAERRLSEALAHLRTARVNPHLEAELHVLRSSYRLVLQERAGARADLEQAMELWPEWSVPCVALAGVLLDEREHEAAWMLIQRARGATFFPGATGHPPALTERNLELFSAEVLRSRGSHVAAAECLTRALDLAPRDLDVRLMLGQTLLDIGDNLRAREVLEPAGEDEAGLERLVEITVAIGLARVRTGDLDGAGACLSPLLDLFADRLGHAEEAGPIELAEALWDAGYANAAKNMIALFQATLLETA